MKRDRINDMPRVAGETGRLGMVEFLAMNNPVRRFLHRHVEFRYFRESLGIHSINLAGKIVMDAGCGSGYGTKLIVDEFRPSRVIAFDLMPEQIALARKRGLGVDFFVGDMTEINVPDGTCDAVFIFGVLHHVKEWRGAVKEVIRILKPGGVILVEEPPYGFTWRELEGEFRTSGLTLLASRKFFLRFLCAYVWRKQGAGSDISKG
jgi:ubiquinone/menaquinone biosynthesis C-methylase UbiE